MVVSNETCVQKQVKLLDDGLGGAYVFWLDSRSECSSSTNNDIYGQYYDSDGEAQWEAGGRLIWDLSKNISSAELIKGENEGEIIMAVFTNGGFGQDSLLVQKIDAAGELMWNDYLLIATNDGCVGNFFLGFETLNLIKDNDGYVLNFVPIYCGGANGCRITRFDDSGNLTGALNGSAVGNQSYIGVRGIAPTQDGTNDVFLYYSGGNGAGAPAYCMRLDDTNNVIWGPTNVMEGTNGLNYQYDAIADASGIAVVYQSYNNAETGIDIFIRKLNNDGSWAWSGEIKNVCSYEGTQAYFSYTQDDEFYYFIWADSRLEGDGYYSQKIDKATGEEVWITGGKLIQAQTSYAYTPALLLQDDGNLLASIVSPFNSGSFYSILLNQDGDFLWSSPVTVASSNYLPFYTDQKTIYSNNQALVAWTRFTAQDGVFIACIKAPQILTTQSVSACNSYTIGGQTYTTSGIYEIQLSEDTLLTLDLSITEVNASFEESMTETAIISNGTVGFNSWYLCDDWYTKEIDEPVLFETGTTTFYPPDYGYYSLVVELNGCVDTSDCIFIIVGSTQEVNSFPFRLYPNPAKDILIIHGEEQTVPQHIAIIDAVGKRVAVDSNLQTMRKEINVASLPSGLYFIEISTLEKTYHRSWIKE